MLKSSDLQSLQEAYQNIYEENDGISLEMIEEVVEELIEECVECGYTLDEAIDTVENAALLYIDEAKITYGSDTESPEQRRERAKGRLGGMKSSARKAAVKGAVERVKEKASGAKAMVGIAGSIAKDEAKRAGRAAKQAVTGAVEKKKAEVKKGVKGLLARGLRAAAGAAGSVAQKARKAGAAAGRAAERLSEEQLNEISLKTKMSAFKKRATDEFESDGDNPRNYTKGGASKADKTKANIVKKHGEKAGQHAERAAHTGIFGRKSFSMPKKPTNEEFDVFDVVLEYLLDTGHAETISEAQYIMSQMDSESIEAILETRMDPRGRPASGPMNVYANPKNKPSQAHLDAVKAHREAEAKKSPEQRKKELDDYIERQRNR
jgi:hypothetical protein